MWPNCGRETSRLQSLHIYQILPYIRIRGVFFAIDIMFIIWFHIFSNIVNLLINMPHDSLEELLTPLNDGSNNGPENKEIEFEGKNMEAIVILLGFLMRRLEKVIIFVSPWMESET